MPGSVAGITKANSRKNLYSRKLNNIAYEVTLLFKTVAKNFKNLQRMPKLKTKKLKRDYEKYLNYLYSELPQETAMDQLIYLTNPTRSTCVTENRLHNAWVNFRLGAVLRKYDPIKFNSGFDDWDGK